MLSLLISKAYSATATKPMDLLDGGSSGNKYTLSNFEGLFDTLKEYVLPFIPFLIVIGSIIYFLIGIRSKEKREKGVNFMISAAFIYLILETVPLVMELVDLKAFEGIETSTYEVIKIILDGIRLLSLPTTVFFVIVGYIISNTIGARNMQKKRVGDTMTIGSVVFCIFINIVILLYPLVFKS